MNINIVFDGINRLLTVTWPNVDISKKIIQLMPSIACWLCLLLPVMLVSSSCADG